MAKAKEIAGLDCGAEARAGVRLVLLTRLEEMSAFRAAAVDQGDIAGVHDMRVASRRLRSALGDFLPYLRKRKLLQSKDDLKRVAQALGRVRDQDVAINALEELAAQAPPEIAAGIGEFAAERRMKRDRERSGLNDWLTEERLAEVLEEFHDSLERGLKDSRGRKRERAHEGMSFREAGREVIRARLRELLDLSESLYRPLKSRPLHRLRIAAKRLRYALELFAPCWSEPLIPFAKEIARLQKSLGELHDSDLWIKELGEALADSKDESGGAPERSAAFWLLDHFVGKRDGHFRDALARWREWETTDFQAHILAALEDRAPAIEPASLDTTADVEEQQG
ncbi:MAG TPA: CHAD domain-containing protein [Pyrinomonadaceae bacterium]|nr:CHAD domain-containing protein [Pyrinomonadaceae bacterium]